MLLHKITVVQWYKAVDLVCVEVQLTNMNICLLLAAVKWFSFYR